MIKNCQIIFPKVIYRTPPENAFMNVYFYFYSVVKCGNRALGINERIKKIFSDTKSNPNPPLSRSDRGPSGGPVLKGFLRKRAPSGQSTCNLCGCGISVFIESPKFGRFYENQNSSNGLCATESIFIESPKNGRFYENEPAHP